MAAIETIGGQSVLLVSGDDPVIATERAATDLIGDAMGGGAEVIAVPATRLGDAFFELKSGLAGAWAQKIVNYRMKLAVIGDISAQLAASKSLADWVREANAGRDICFLPDRAALEARLAA